MKCKVCGFRLGNDMKKCPMCGAEAGNTIAGEISAEMDLPKYLCSSCNGEILGEHRYCPHCGIDLKEAIRESETARKAEEAQLACKCPKCGAEVQMNSKFCPECGAKQNETMVQNVVDNSEIRQTTAQLKTSEQQMNVKTETMQDNTSQQEINQSAKKQSENLKPNPVGFWMCTIFAFVFLCISVLKDFSVIGGALFIGVLCTGFNWTFIFHGKNKSERMGGYIAWGFFYIFPVLAAIL